MVKLLHVGHSEFLWTFSTTFPNLKWKLVLIGTELVLGVNMKVLDNFVSFLVALVWRENDVWSLSYDENTTGRSHRNCTVTTFSVSCFCVLFICFCFELIFVVNMKVVDICDIFPVALVWHENMLWIIYYVFTKIHSELLLMFKYDVIWSCLWLMNMMF